jgi:hypothetical protein
MNLIDPNQVSDVQSLRNIAETYKLAHESANTRAGEMEFALLDYKRAHGNSQLVIDQLNAQVAQLTARVRDLEETLAPLDACNYGGPAGTTEEPTMKSCNEHPDGCVDSDHDHADPVPAAEDSVPSAT